MENWPRTNSKFHRNRSAVVSCRLFLSFDFCFLNVCLYSSRSWFFFYNAICSRFRTSVPNNLINLFPFIFYCAKKSTKVKFKTFLFFLSFISSSYTGTFALYSLFPELSRMIIFNCLIHPTFFLIPFLIGSILKRVRKSVFFRWMFN